MEQIVDLLDRKILFEIDRNSRQSNNQIGRKLGVSRERVEYRIKQMIARGVINKFPTIINPTKFGYAMHKLYFRFRGITHTTLAELTHWLVHNPYVQWVAECKGPWDMNIIVFARDVEQFNQIMQEFYNRYGNYIHVQQFNITLAVGNMAKNWLVNSSQRTTIIYTANERADVSMDTKDLEILKLLANNARLSVVDIAEKLQLTPRIVQYRIKVLERKEVIKGYTISLNYTLLKRQFYKVIFYFTVITDNLKQRLIEYCRKRPDMPYFIFCVGEWPFEVEYVVDNLEQFYTALEDIKQHFPEIQRYETIWLSKEHKFDFMPLC